MEKGDQKRISRLDIAGIKIADAIADDRRLVSVKKGACLLVEVNDMGAPLSSTQTHAQRKQK